MARNTNSTGFSLKDHLFNEQKIQYLAELFKKVDTSFPAKQFIDQVMSKLLTLELKARIHWIAEVLHDYLPADYRQACKKVVAALPSPLDPTLRDDDFGDFIFAPLGAYVVRYCTSARDVPTALAALRTLTMRFSMEDAIRFFINEYPDQTFAQLDKWVHDTNYHVRRLVSEGTRPHLPWSVRLSTSYKQALPYLDTLHADATRYVTRSVANHLNDVSKIDPNAVIQMLARWEKQNLQDPRELAWMTKHALRTLIKAGHKEALAHLGYALSQVTVQKADVTPTAIVAGETITIAVELIAAVSETILVDYRIGFIKNNGRLAYKTYKLKSVEITAGQPLTLTKTHRLRKDTTTLTLYEGQHMVVLVINGTEHPVGAFLLQL